MSKPIEDAADIISEQKALIEELQAKLAAQAAPVVAASADKLPDSVIARAKRVMLAIDEYLDHQESGKRAAIRTALMDEFAALAAAPAASVAVPAGFALVPVEPIDEMRAATKHLAYASHIDEDWAAMLAAAPATPAAQAQQPAGDGWMPIATAPRDGTAILLSNGTAVCQGAYIYEEPGIKDVRDLDGRHIDQIESDGFDGWMDFDGGMLPDPTHWQPLPAPPAPGLMEAE